MHRCIVLLSGGLDSTVATAYMEKEGYEITALTFDYDQNKKEIEAAKKISDYFNAEFILLKIDFLKFPQTIPTISEKELKNLKITEKSARSVWVPARNLVFCAIASSLAEKNNIKIIATGFDLEEASTFPDNSINFVEKFNELLKYACLKKVKLFAPLVNMNKKEIVELGVKLNAPMDLSWSCYKDGKNPCGTCESCQRRKRAFREAGIKETQIKR